MVSSPISILGLSCPSGVSGQCYCNQNYAPVGKVICQRLPAHRGERLSRDLVSTGPPAQALYHCPRACQGAIRLPFVLTPEGAASPFDLRFRFCYPGHTKAAAPRGRCLASRFTPTRESAGRVQPPFPGSKGCPLDPPRTLLGGSGGKKNAHVPRGGSRGRACLPPTDGPRRVPLPTSPSPSAILTSHPSEATQCAANLTSPKQPCPIDAPAPCCARFALFRPHFAPFPRSASPSLRFRPPIAKNN